MQSIELPCDHTMDDVTYFEDDIIHNYQFTPGVQADDLARPTKRSLLVSVVTKFCA